MLVNAQSICTVFAPLGNFLMSPSIYKTNKCNKEEQIILKPTANTHAHLLSASLYNALPKNSITNVQVHRMCVLALAFT
jgi:hypothetical protein